MTEVDEFARCLRELVVVVKESEVILGDYVPITNREKGEVASYQAAEIQLSVDISIPKTLFFQCLPLSIVFITSNISNCI